MGIAWGSKNKVTIIFAEVEGLLKLVLSLVTSNKSYS
jgi:hypothetical protein